MRGNIQKGNMCTVDINPILDDIGIADISKSYAMPRLVVLEVV